MSNKKYPKVMTEDQTVDAMVAGASIARYGDGELRCAVGGGCTSQRKEESLSQELQQVLRSQADGFIVGIPNHFSAQGAPRRESWMKYSAPEFCRLLDPAQTYASSFITRPDNAPWIDRPDYWAKIRMLWAQYDVILVTGDKKSVTTEMIGHEAGSVCEVQGPRQHAYGVIDDIERQVCDIEKPGDTVRVLICLGTAATVLAWRLWRRGYVAQDLGHVGMFMRHAGSYRYTFEDLASPDYRRQLESLHASRRWGADGAKHAQTVEEIAARMNAVTILDYGCGENRLAETLLPRRVSGYDPGIPERAKMPKPCDLVVCTDVLEHVEPDRLDAVLDHIYRLTARRAYLVISTRLANAVLPDGRNAHLSVHPAGWWIERLGKQGWTIESSVATGKDIAITVAK